MQTAIYNRSLPLLAQALSEQRNITVEIGGSEAFTDGKTIHLPALPINSNEKTLTIARGFIDHESAHIIFSNIPMFQESKLDPLTHFLANAIEDIRIEARMAERYPGSRKNLQETAKYVFIEKADERQESVSIPNWLLLEMRFWALPDLSSRINAIRQGIKQTFSGLQTKLAPILNEIRDMCYGNLSNTAMAITLAQKLVAAISEMASTPNADTTDNCDMSVNQANNNCDASTTSSEKAKIKSESGSGKKQADLLNAILNAKESDLPKNIGNMLAEELDAQASFENGGFTLAKAFKATFKPMSSNDVMLTQRLTDTLRPRLQGLLQAQTFNGHCDAYSGALCARRMYSAVLGNGKVFSKRIPAKHVNTSLHVILDRSASTFEIIREATVSAYAIVQAAQSLRGLEVGLTAFPATASEGVIPLIEQGKKMHTFYEVDATGATPLADALWYILPKLRLPRKIIIVFTDGQPDYGQKVEAVLKDAYTLGVEVYAISYRIRSVRSFFKHCVVINDIHELHTAFFNMLVTAIKEH